MKDVLVIGSTVADVVIHIEELPQESQAVHILSQTIQLGGCAYNVSAALARAGVPYTLCSPVGTGIYGDFVRKSLKEKNIPIFADIKDLDNGCCYCLIDKTGERTFMSRHGAEYVFYPERMNDVDLARADSIYVCGLEIEEPSGEDLVRWLENTFEPGSVGRHAVKKRLYFAPSPRICRIPLERMERVFALNPILHLNKEEALSFTGEADAELAAKSLFNATKNAVVITLGKDGALCRESEDLCYTVPVPLLQTRSENTNGAGDAHMGALIAAIKKGKPLNEAVKDANEAACALVCAN